MRNRLLALGLLSFGLTACGGATRFASTWVDPAARPTDWDGQKVAAFVLSSRDSIRLGAEETLARELTSRGAQGIAGYTIVPKEVTEDQQVERGQRHRYQTPLNLLISGSSFGNYGRVTDSLQMG